MNSLISTILKYGEVNVADPIFNSYCSTLFVVFLNTLTGVLFYSEKLYITPRNEFHFELNISWMCYMLYLYLTLYGAKRSQGNVNVMMCSNVSMICLLLTCVSYFVRETKVLLVTRFVSWIFALPFRALVEFNVGDRARKKAARAILINQFGTACMFMIAIIQCLYPCFLSRLVLWLSTQDECNMPCIRECMVSV